MNPTLDNGASIFHFLPELIAGLGAVIVLVFSGVDKGQNRKRSAVTLTLFFLAMAFVATGIVALSPYTNVGSASVTVIDRPVALFNGLIVLDPWAVAFKYIGFAATACAVLMLQGSNEVSRDRVGELCALLLIISVGMSLMASATDLMIIAIAIETVSLASYAAVAFRKGNRKSSEAALKYVVYGGVASGTMLFGMSWWYGLRGTTNLLSTVTIGASSLGSPEIGQWALNVASVMILGGVGFKIAIVPWHMWAPDVYEGAPTPFTAFLSVGPKAAGFALAVRLLQGSIGSASIASFQMAWPQIAAVLAAITMTWGNLAALQQTNLKRLLAYSSIAHAGYLLMGVAAGSTSGARSVLIYLVAYLLMNLGASVVVSVLATHSGSESIFECRGLGVRAPGAAIAFTIFLFSLTGLPPFAGFVGKFHLFLALIERGPGWPVALAVVGLLNTVLSLGYYARLVKLMFLDAPTVTTPLVVPGSQRFLISFFAIAVIVLGVWFDGLRRVADTATVFFSHS